MKGSRKDSVPMIKFSPKSLFVFSSHNTTGKKQKENYLDGSTTTKQSINSYVDTKNMYNSYIDCLDCVLSSCFSENGELDLTNFNITLGESLYFDPNLIKFVHPDHVSESQLIFYIENNPKLKEKYSGRVVVQNGLSK